MIAAVITFEQGKKSSLIATAFVVLSGFSIPNAAFSDEDLDDQPFIGEFVYFADAATFRPCGSGDVVPVSQEGAYLTLERAYLESREEPQAPLVIVADGRIADREGMEGGMRPMLIVSRLSGVVPGLSCERAQADSELEDTYWRVLSLGGVPVEVPEGTREAHLILKPDDTTYSATAGCNQFGGAYQADLPSISFSPGPATLMACPSPLDALERSLIEGLLGSESARIVGPTLELFSADGTPEAFFEDIALP